LAGTGVRLLKETLAGDNQFTSATPFIVLVVLLITAFAQV
jgi:hypothetical protein